MYNLYYIYTYILIYNFRGPKERKKKKSKKRNREANRRRRNPRCCRTRLRSERSVRFLTRSNASVQEARVHDLPELGFDLSRPDPVSWICYTSDDRRCFYLYSEFSSFFPILDDSDVLVGAWAVESLWGFCRYDLKWFLDSYEEAVGDESAGLIFSWGFFGLKERGFVKGVKM